MPRSVPDKSYLMLTSLHAWGVLGGGRSPLTADTETAGISADIKTIHNY